MLRAKELRVLRPHGHLLRTGRHLTPDETALTSTVWMSGVFHSMLTQGHVSINRALSTVHSYLALFRSQGLRLFAWIGERWRLLQLPSAFEIAPDACRWIYRHAQGEMEVRSAAAPRPHELTLASKMLSGAPGALSVLASHRTQRRRWQRHGRGRVAAPGCRCAAAAGAGERNRRRFPQGQFR